MQRIIISILALGIATGATMLGVAEYRAFQQNLSSEQDLMLPPGGGIPAWKRPASLRARVDQMALCSSAPQSLFALFLSNGSRDRFAQSCLTRADQILRDTPGLSVAHLAKATAEAELGAPADAARSLALSQATGPNEGWLAILRLRIALNLAQAGYDATLGTAAADILVILQDNGRIARLASEYDKREDLRDWMTMIIEQADSRQQAAFLNAMREQAGE